jgi:hypothetical protein
MSTRFIADLKLLADLPKRIKEFDEIKNGLHPRFDT